MDLNTASVEELFSLPGVSLAAAYDLMLWRPYLSWAEVENTPVFLDLDFPALRAAGLILRTPADPWMDLK